MKNMEIVHEKGVVWMKCLFLSLSFVQNVKTLVA